MTLDLFPQALQRLAEKLFHLAAAQADDVGVLLLEASLVIMLIAAVMHEVELIHQPAFLEHLERAIDSDAVELGIFLLGQLVEAIGIQMLAGLVDEFEQDLPLPGEAHARAL